MKKREKSLEQNDMEQPERIQQQKLKLKPIEIPSFNGDYKQWRSFHDLFYELVHKNIQIGNAVKLQYLKTNLTGEANQLIKHLSITNENYATAWQILKDRYENKRLLLQTPLQTILTQPTLYNENAYGLRKLHDTTKECLHAIRNLNIDIESWGPIIIHIVSQKLDKETRKCFEESLKNPKDIPSLTEFFNFLETRFHALEASNSFKKPEINNVKPKNTNQTYKAFHNTVETLCPICKSKHRTYMCEKYKNLNPIQRKETIKKLQLCTNCLSVGHDKIKCPSSSSCKLCKKRHHTSLHIEKSTNTQSAQNQTHQGSQLATKDIQVHNHFAGNKVQALLATAILKIYHKGHEILLRALLDQGSQSSFITE